MTHFRALRPLKDENTDSEARLLELALNGVTSEHSRRSYRTGLVAFFAWVRDREAVFFTKALVQAYRGELVSQGLAASTMNLRLTPIRKLPREIADNGLLEQHTRINAKQQATACSFGSLFEGTRPSELSSTILLTCVGSAGTFGHPHSGALCVSLFTLPHGQAKHKCSQRTTCVDETGSHAVLKAFF